jgi:hypothetical protein
MTVLAVQTLRSTEPDCNVIALKWEKSVFGRWPSWRYFKVEPRNSHTGTEKNSENSVIAGRPLKIGTGYLPNTSA